MKRKIQSPIIEFRSSKSLKKDAFAEQEKNCKCLGYLELEPIKELYKSKLPSNSFKTFFLIQNDHTSNIPKQKIVKSY